MPSARELLQVLHVMVGGRETGPATLAELSARAGWSPFHLHRAFRQVVRETPKQFTLRLRLERAAARLVTSDDTVLAIAMATGFASHEVFTRAFRRHFGTTPVRYRATALANATPAARAAHAATIARTGPCISLYHLPLDPPGGGFDRRVPMPTLSIDRKDLSPQPAVYVRRRVARHEISSAIAEGLGKVFPHAQKSGAALGGPPFTRYLATGPGLFTLEIGMPLATPATGEGDVEAGALRGGPAAVGIHAGPYDQLGETYAAMERWIEAQGFRIADAPWESYVTDPGDHPNPADWRTEIYWPLAE